MGYWNARSIQKERGTSMKIEQYVVGSVATNCYFVIQEKTNQMIVIDPGACAKQLGEKIDAAG